MNPLAVGVQRVAAQRTESYDCNAVRTSLQKLRATFGELDPFLRIKAGDTVFIKPNWVAHRYRASCPCQDTVWSTITHSEVIAAVAECAAEQAGASGTIIIGDNPSIDADFAELQKLNQLEERLSQLPCKLELVDLRPLVCVDLKDYGKREKMQKRAGDPRGGSEIDLAGSSALEGLSPEYFRGVFDERDETIHSHSEGRHRYTLAKSIVEADVYISVPKLKTHHKVGTTLNLKGLVGTVLNKNQLVHWRQGYPAIGGDEYPDQAAHQAGEVAQVKSRGAWPGNDTIWRMVVDLANALYQARASRTAPFSVIDGIIGGEGNGPFCPRAKESKQLLLGSDLLATDLMATQLMGFPPQKIRYLEYFISDVAQLDSCVSTFLDGKRVENFFRDAAPHLQFQAPNKWVDHLK